MCLVKEYFETLELKADGVIQFGDNKTCEVHDIDIIRLKRFDNCAFLPFNVMYGPELKKNLFSINMFDDLCYCTRVEYKMLKISHDA